MKICKISSIMELETDISKKVLVSIQLATNSNFSY
jgi:hypothetical protein